MALPAFSSDLTLASSEAKRPCRAVTRSSDLEDLSRISPRTHYRHSPHMPDMSTRPEGDFQRVIVDALTAIWARVSRCCYSSKRSVRASSPSAGSSSDETADED
ncbi:hypothetical protein F2Q70_00043060 [Brassica cretica]|uniref:Uncharacterized protein n=1 Tax=Brassica cretica TaxID=69181 RepID=A0A8S9KP57_BRACR|nr:hypothetical protein F2Q68_00004989 [Brassica cretica]KAF2595083.1 hypothetical protein F2Q70_00043060 [Brassica cretica]